MRVSNVQPPTGTVLNKSHPLSQGLVLCYPMNEGGGRAINDMASGNLVKNRGILQGVTTFGKFKNGTGVLFGGSPQYIESPISTTWVSNTKGLTVSFWYKFTSIAGTQRFISWWDGTHGFIAYFVSGTTIRFLIDTTNVGGNAFVDTTVGVDIVNPHHYCGTYDGANLIIYIDGILKATLAETRAITTNTGVTRIGRTEGAGTNYLLAYLNDMKIYNRGLSQTEVWQLYSSPYCMFQQARPLKLAV